MEYTYLARERLDYFEREHRAMYLVAEAQRLGLVRRRSLAASLDGLLIRAGKGARRRQARREYAAANNRSLAS
ncbi:MAG: hypothetical protein IPI33_08625 [Dehalococcoidia bacterium]|nr:hypothetical protein [Dehalococcoidia bacterium]